VNILQPHAKTAAVAQRRAHRTQADDKIHEYLVDAVPGHVLGNVPHSVLPRTGSAVCSIRSQRPEPLAVTAAKIIPFIDQPF